MLIFSLFHSLILPVELIFTYCFTHSFGPQFLHYLTLDTYHLKWENICKYPSIRVVPALETVRYVALLPILCSLMDYNLVQSHTVISDGAWGGFLTKDRNVF